MDRRPEEPTYLEISRGFSGAKIGAFPRPRKHMNLSQLNSKLHQEHTMVAPSSLVGLRAAAAGG